MPLPRFSEKVPLFKYPSSGRGHARPGDVARNQGVAVLRGRGVGRGGAGPKKKELPAWAIWSQLAFSLDFHFLYKLSRSTSPRLLEKVVSRAHGRIASTSRTG